MSELLANPTTRLLIVVSIAVVVVVIAVYIANRSDSSDNCKSDSDCNSSDKPVCHEQKCVQCAFNSDCPGTSTCNQNRCVAVDASSEQFTCSGCPAIPSLLSGNSPDGDGGFTIAYNPVDGLLYRVSGGFDDFYVETFDPAATDGVATLVHDGVDISAIFESNAKITAMVYDTAENQWIISSNDEFIGRLNADFTSTTGTVGVVLDSGVYRSLVLLGDGSLVGTTIEGDTDIYVIDLVAETQTPVTLTNTDWDLNEIWGAAYDPVSQMYYFNCMVTEISSSDQYVGIATGDITAETFSPTCASSGTGEVPPFIYADMVFAPTGILFLQQGNDLDGELHRLPSAPCAGSFLDESMLLLNHKKTASQSNKKAVQGPLNKSSRTKNIVATPVPSHPVAPTAPKEKKIRMRARNRRK